MELEAKHFSSSLYLSLDITKGSTLLPFLHTTVTLSRPSVVPDTYTRAHCCSLCRSRQVWRINTLLKVQQDYIHKVPVILHENRLRRFSQTVKALLLQSHDCSCYVSRPILAPPRLWLQKHADPRAYTTSRTPSICDISLGPLTLLAPEAGDFVELLLLYKVYFSIMARKKNRHCGR